MTSSKGSNASAVTIAFAEVVPALQKGVADCGITGTMPAYNAKWWQVVTHNIRIRARLRSDVHRHQHGHLERP